MTEEFENDALNCVLDRAEKIEAQLNRIATALEKLTLIVNNDDKDDGLPYANIIATCGVIST